MLRQIGVDHIDDLFSEIPDAYLLKDGIEGLETHQDEMAVERLFETIAKRNIPAGSGPFFLGGGAYRHHIPASVDHLIQRGEFLTSYTPYQPEIAQGTLQMLFEFQSQVARLFKMDVANASLYDGSTATVEAVLMARRITKRDRAILSASLHPHYQQTVRTVVGSDIDIPPLYTEDEIDDQTPSLIARLKEKHEQPPACVVVQYPDFFGHVEDFTALAEACQDCGALLVVVVTEVVSLGLLKSPGAMGADIVVGEGQGLGNALNFGGPYLGLFATHRKYQRQIPGRLCGESVDQDGKRSFVLTLSTREQHIRRHKATSNICTNSGLCALAFSIHLSLLGGSGLKHLATVNHRKACDLASRLNATGTIRVHNRCWFNEFTVRLNRPAGPLVEQLAQKKLMAGIPLSRFYGDDAVNDLLVAVTEYVSEEDMDQLVSSLKESV